MIRRLERIDYDTVATPRSVGSAGGLSARFGVFRLHCDIVSRPIVL